MIELQRCLDAGSVAETTGLLDAAGIEYRVSSTASNFDFATIGSGGGGEAIINVARADYEPARAAMEAEFCEMDLPEGYHLLSASDDELIEIVGQSTEWSAYDVAHAKRLIAERGVDLAEADEKKTELIEQLKAGKPAPPAMIPLGWICTFAGGLIGIGIAWTLCTAKERTPHGDFFTYDEESRNTGKAMRLVGIAVLAIVLGIGFFIRNADGH